MKNIKNQSISIEEIQKYIISEIIFYNIENKFCTPINTSKKVSKFDIGSQFIQTLKDLEFNIEGPLVETKLDKLLINIFNTGSFIYCGYNIELLIINRTITDYIKDLIRSNQYNFFHEIKGSIDELIMGLDLKQRVRFIIMNLIKDNMIKSLVSKNFFYKNIYKYFNLSPINFNIYFFEFNEINLDLIKININNRKVGLIANSNRDEFFGKSKKEETERRYIPKKSSLNKEIKETNENKK